MVWTSQLMKWKFDLIFDQFEQISVNFTYTNLGQSRFHFRSRVILNN